MRQMKRSLYNLSDLIKFRQTMHQQAEVGFEEVQTQKSIIAFLKKLGLKDTQIKKCAKTGLFVDLVGQKKSTQSRKLIAFRADIDALPGEEGNNDLPYRSKTKAAHLCGHDGHTTCLLGFAARFLEKIEEVPQNLGVRLLFQPCEEGNQGKSGAKAMIDDGALKDVQEVYGFHNWPTDLVGHAYVKAGPVMSEIVKIKIKIIGKGGHGSEPSKCNDPLQPAIDIHNYVRELIKSYEEKKIQFRLTLPVLQSGSACNVIADTALIEGTFRIFDEKISKEFCENFSQKVDDICLKHKCTNEKSINSLYPAVINSEKETESIMKLTKEFFGEGNVDDSVLPIYASEDFSYFLKERPGTFIFVCSGRKKNDDYLHTANFNFNDDLIPVAADFWLKIAEGRLGIDKSVFAIKNMSEREKIVKEEQKDKNGKENVTKGSKKIKKSKK